MADLELFQLDFHLGVIATEVNDTETGMGTPPRDIIPGVLVQAPGRPKVVTNGTPQTVTAFTENFDMGACCSEEQEAGLQAAWMALSPSYLSDPTRNAGFLRDEARLVLVVAGDEDDQSVETVAFYADFFKSLKADRGSDWIRFFAITSPMPEGCGEYAASARYAEAADALGGGVFSICQATSADFEIVMQNIVPYSADPLDTFRLSQEPDPGSLMVTVGGNPVSEASSFRGPDGWTYLVATRELYIGTDETPPRGSEVVISYRGICP
jgi:hypothetical protein